MARKKMSCGVLPFKAPRPVMVSPEDELRLALIEVVRNLSDDEILAMYESACEEVEAERGA